MSTTARPRGDQLADALRRWTGKDDHKRAAEELLIEHGFWLRRTDFLDAALRYDSDDAAALIMWSKAREFLDTEPRASTTELAVLDLAAALGEDRFQLTAMGRAHRDMVRTAVNTALGEH